MSSVHQAHAAGACAIAAHSPGDSGPRGRPDWRVAILGRVIVAAKSAGRAMRFHDRSTRAEDSDDSDDEDQGENVTAWKFGSAKKSLA